MTDKDSSAPEHFANLKAKIKERVLTPDRSRPGKLTICPPSERAPFLLRSDYSPAGDQPQAIEEITEEFKSGGKFQVLLGVTGSGKTFTMANVIKNLEKPTLILTHNKTLAAQLYQEFKAFFPENAVEYFVSYYDYYQPEAYIVASDVFIDKDASINDEIDKLRLRATKNLLTRRDTIIVASVSCIYGLGSPVEYFELMVRLKIGEERDRDSILRDLVSIQYDRNDFALERGTFRVRGDRIDIYPSYDDTGLRIELFGDTIEKLSWFHIVTGETLKSVGEMVIAPAKHFVTRENSRERIVNQIEKELNRRLIEFQEEGKELEAARLKGRVRYDMELIRETGICPGIENYSRVVENRLPGTRPYTLWDYFGEDWLLIIDESHASIPQVSGMSAGDRSRKSTLVDYGWRLPCALDNRPMNFMEFEHEYPPSVLFVSATPADYELKKTDGKIVEQINRPTGLLDPKIDVMPIEGQMTDLLIRVRETVADGNRILVTTLTKKMAQDLTDYLLEKGAKARYLHSDIKTLDRHEIIRELRMGKFDVLVGINLLREGLDIPEVALVAVLDADKEGFLRNYKSLIQTMGRASRNVKGRVILYADKMTDAMKKAILETNRRRNRQIEFNRKNNIIPRNVKRKLEDMLEIQDPLMEIKGKNKKGKAVGSKKPGFSEGKDNRSVEELEAAMKEAAAQLDFEEAARLRDLIRKKRW
ncbi:MAG: excinuclease ABC subunit UvrB [Candidatus Fibromonas sp.]|jgi:excinuclease ABC subunit B|nr:excinuclease ABC subunit UvrB [Candidatus Fibromonas sp.]